MPHGILIPRAHTAAALAAGADHVEPTIVGNLVVPDEDGGWQPAPDLDEVPPAPSSAVLVPASLRIADPSTPLEPIGDYLRVALDAVARRATPGATVVLGSGAARTVPEGADRIAAEARFGEVVRLARDLAAERGLEVLLEPLHRGETDLIHTIEEAVAFLDAHDLPSVRVVADLFHIMLEDEPLEVVRRHAGRVGHAHIADSGRTPPGQGDWPLAAFLTALREGGYDGDVAIECTWADLPTEAAPALRALRAADPLEGHRS